MGENITIIDAQGYFSRGGTRIFPLGVNYWPASTGVDMWQVWPESEIRRDLDLVRDLGLNCVRFFLRWPDFEPELGKYNELMFDRLGRFLCWCGERGILAHPSLFVGFMSGGCFWPKGKNDRSLVEDPGMVGHSAAYAGKAAGVISAHCGDILAIDLGNELDVLREIRVAPASAVRGWCQAVCGAIREACPGALIVMGNDHNQCASDTGWHLGDEWGTDFYSMHAYPVHMWGPVVFDGLADPLAQSMLPFYTRAARMFGPVLVQEFGTIMSGDPGKEKAYLDAALEGCFAAGANGFLWWCLRDIVSANYPYLANGFEGMLGLVDQDGNPKPGARVFLDFARGLAGRQAPDRLPEDAALYWPKHYYSGPGNPGNEPPKTSRRLALAGYMLGLSGLKAGLVRGGGAIPAGVKTLVLPCVLPDRAEAEALEQWVRAGGRLVWHGPGFYNWGRIHGRLLGARVADLRAPTPVEVDFSGETWNFSQFPVTARLELDATTAEILARDKDGLPAVIVNRLGRGTAVCATPLVEDEIALVSGDRKQRDRWAAWYDGMLKA